MLLNWAGNYAYRAERLHRPASVEQLRAIVAAAPQILDRDIPADPWDVPLDAVATPKEFLACP